MKRSILSISSTPLIQKPTDGVVFIVLDGYSVNIEDLLKIRNIGRNDV